MSITLSDGFTSTIRQRPHSSSITLTAGPGTTLLSASSSGGAEAGRRSRPQQRRGRDSGSSTTEGDEIKDWWHTVLEDDEEPEQFRFKLKQTEDQQLVSDETLTTLQLFQLYFTTSVLVILICNTNKYGSRSSRVTRSTTFPW
jgi:hypothetical protein